MSQSRARYEQIELKINSLQEERLMFDVFFEIQFQDKPTKMIYKAVVHENLLLIQHVTVLDQDQDLGMLDIMVVIYPGPRYESLSNVSILLFQ